MGNDTVIIIVSQGPLTYRKKSWEGNNIMNSSKNEYILYVSAILHCHFAEAAGLILFCMSAVLFIAGTIAILLGILCRIGQLHSFKFQNQSYQVLQGETKQGQL